MKAARTKNATSARRRNQGGATDEGAEPRQRPVVHRDPAEKATDQKAERREHVDKCYHNILRLPVPVARANVQSGDCTEGV